MTGFHLQHFLWNFLPALGAYSFHSLLTWHSCSGLDSGYIDMHSYESCFWVFWIDKCLLLLAVFFPVSCMTLFLRDFYNPKQDSAKYVKHNWPVNCFCHDKTKIIFSICMDRTPYIFLSGEKSVADMRNVTFQVWPKCSYFLVTVCYFIVWDLRSILFFILRSLEANHVRIDLDLGSYCYCRTTNVHVKSFLPSFHKHLAASWTWHSSK